MRALIAQPSSLRLCACSEFTDACSVCGLVYVSGLQNAPGMVRRNTHIGAMSKEKQPVVIKKYANRRLYHTGTSSYVTLEDLSALVRGGEDFVVYDAKTGEEITRSVLAQIIFEEENKEGQNLLPISFLRQLIRIYGDSMQAVVPRYLEFSMENLAKEQTAFRQQMAKNLGIPGFDMIERQTQANMKMFVDAFSLFNPFAQAQAKEEAKEQAKEQAQAQADGAAPATKPKDDIEGLRDELAIMRDKLDKLSGKG
jgi:polyhydroxyalkanoate synthesis repressor PhaR